MVADVLLSNGTQVWKCSGGKWNFYDALHTLVRPLPDGSQELAGAVRSNAALAVFTRCDLYPHDLPLDTLPCPYLEPSIAALTPHCAAPPQASSR